MNKKGVSLGWSDVFLSLILSVVMIFLVGLFMFFSDSNTSALENFESFKGEEASLNNLKVKLYENVDLDNVDVSKTIEESKIIGGRTIESCEDYITEGECSQDIHNVKGDDSSCIWFDNQCIFVSNDDDE
jgi:hypothetical protein